MRRKNGYGGAIKYLIALLLLCPTLSWACGYNGSGTYVRCYNWTQDANNGIPITASRFDTEDNGFATGLSSVMTLNGQSVVTANLPMSGFRFTGVGNGLFLTDFAATSQVQNNEFNYGAENGSSVNAYVVGNGNVIPNALQSGQLIWFKPPITNTASSTLNWDNLGAKPVLRTSTTTLSAGDLVSGSWYGAVYDPSASSAGGYVLISPPGTIVNASWYGLANIPTPVQNVSNGTSLVMASISTTALAVTGSATFAAGLTASGDITATGRTVTAAIVTATAGYFGNVSASTLNGNALPFSKCVTSGDLTISQGGRQIFTHSLGATPTFWTTWLRNTTGQLGYVVGDVVGIEASNGTNSVASLGYNIIQNSTSTTIVFGGGAAGAINILQAGSGTQSTITAGDWVFVVRECI